MPRYLKFKCTNHIVLWIIFTFTIICSKVKTQCIYSPVLAKTYITSDCGSHKTQSLVGIEIPIYGHKGSLVFTSPLTSNTMFTSIENTAYAPIEIYPNPALEFVQVTWSNNEDAQLIIYSQIGQLISMSKIESHTISTIDISQLRPGYYIIKAVTPNSLTFISKLIKQ